MNTRKRLVGGMLAFALTFAAVEYIPCFEGTSIVASAEEAAPENVKASYKDSKLSITWDKVDGADAYKVSYKYQGDKKYTNYKTVKNNICTMKDPKAGKKISILVTPLYKTNKGYTSGKSSGISKIIKEEAAYTSSVKLLSYSSLSSTSVTLTWGDAAGADDYIIYKVTDGKRYQVNTTIKKTRNGKSAKISGLSEGTDYTFAVVPVKEIKGSEEEGKEKTITITTSKKQTSSNKPSSTSTSSNYIPRDMPNHENIGVKTTDEYLNYLKAAGFKIEKNIYSDPYYSSYKYVIYDNGVIAGYFSSINYYIDV